MSRLSGNSMGALLGFEMIHQWVSWGVSPPENFSLGARPPHCSFAEPLSDLPSENFREALLQLGGIPDTILTDEESMSFFEALLRQDFSNCESYRCIQPNPLPCPIQAIAYDQDPLMTVEETARWGDCTAEQFRLTTLTGEPHILTADTLMKTVQNLFLDYRPNRKSC